MIARGSRDLTRRVHLFELNEYTSLTFEDEDISLLCLPFYLLLRSFLVRFSRCFLMLRNSFSKAGWMNLIRHSEGLRLSGTGISASLSRL